MLNENNFIFFLYRIFPQKILNNHAWAINNFIKNCATRCDRKNKIVLDIGAGELPYRHFFTKCLYQSQDVVNNEKKTIDYVCDANKIPLKESSVDCIICTQVLEHIKEPHLVIKEMYRLLKKGGKVFLTTHLCMEEHMLPYDYFRFTRYGLAFLAESNKFKVESITPQGGRFLVLAKQLQTAFPHIIKNKLLIYLYYLFALIPVFITNLLCYYLDKLDHDKILTTNYECIFVK